MVPNTFAADAPDRPLHVLYLGPVSVGGDFMARKLRVEYPAA